MRTFETLLIRLDLRVYQFYPDYNVYQFFIPFFIREETNDISPKKQSTDITDRNEINRKRIIRFESRILRTNLQSGFEELKSLRHPKLESFEYLRNRTAYV